jgi:hypothetical protein
MASVWRQDLETCVPPMRYSDVSARLYRQRSVKRFGASSLYRTVRSTLLCPMARVSLGSIRELVAASADECLRAPPSCEAGQ